MFYSDEKYEWFFERIRHLIMLKSNITYVYSHKYAIFKINSDDDLPFKKPWTMENLW